MPSVALIAAPAAAEMLGITVQRLYELSREGVVPSVRLGRSFRYSPSALNEFIQRGGDGWAGGWKKAKPAIVPIEASLEIDRRA